MPISLRTRTCRAVAVSSVAALTLMGCAEQESLSASQRVSNATSALSDGSAMAVTMSFDVDDASVAALVEEVGADAPAGLVERVLGGSLEITMATTDGSKLSDVGLVTASAEGMPDNLVQSFSFVVGGEALLEARALEDHVFVRADVDTFAELAGQPTMAADLREMADELDGSVADSMRAFADGRWLSVDREALEQTSQDRPASADPEATAAADPSAMAGAVEDFLSDAKAVLDRELVVEEKENDSYTVTAPLDRILDGLTPSFADMADELVAMSGLPIDSSGPAPADAMTSGLADASEALAGRQMTLDVTLDGDRLSTVRVDLAQLLDDTHRRDLTDSGVAGVPLLLTFSDEGVVEAPQGAVEFDVAEALGLFGMGAGAGMGLDGMPLDPSADPFAGLTAEEFGMTEEEFEAFKAEMGAGG